MKQILHRVIVLYLHPQIAIMLDISRLGLENKFFPNGGGQPIWLKLRTEAGCDEIFQKPLWLTSLTSSFAVTGGCQFLPFEHQKSSLQVESVIRLHW